jgi:hypothetical protein
MKAIFDTSTPMVGEGTGVRYRSIEEL